MPADLQSWAIAVSLLLHGCVAGTLAITRGCAPEPSVLFDPSEVMEVTMAALPKSAGRQPDRASRAPSPAEGQQQAAAPPQQPTDQMSFKDPTKEKAKGEERPKDRSKERDDLLASMRRADLVRQLADAPLGDVDRMATDPDSTLTMEEAFGLGGGVGPVDPEAARYLVQLRQNLLPHWNPLPRIIEEHPSIFTVVDIWLDDDGEIADSGVKAGSGIDAFDSSCLLAIAKAARLPLPPDRFRVETRKGIQIRVTFRASDAQK
ncbi:MAG: cell envelope integrity protein TolA [Pseudomonadota bacterium]